MKFKPHDYQSYCIAYIKTHPVAALFLDMGLGKTAITLTALRDLMLDDLVVSKALVIAPLRVARDTGRQRRRSGISSMIWTALSSWATLRPGRRLSITGHSSMS